MLSDFIDMSMGIQIGNLDSYNFLDYVVNREIGGIVKYTSKKDLLGDNLKPNFKNNDGQNGRRYDYKDINTSDYYYATDGRNVGTVQSYIGDIYSVNGDYKETTLKFITNEEFLKMSEKIRGNSNNTTNTKNDKYTNKSSERYYHDENIEYNTTPISLKIGDLYKVEHVTPKTSPSLDIVANAKRTELTEITKTIKDNKEVDGSNNNNIGASVYNHASVKSLNKGPFSAASVYNETITELFNDEKRKFVKRIEIGSKTYKDIVKQFYISKIPQPGDLLKSALKDIKSATTEFNTFMFSDTKISDVDLKIKSGSGLYEYSGEYRKSAFKEKKWVHDKPYGLDIKTDILSKYNVDEKNTFKGDLKLNNNVIGSKSSLLSATKTYLKNAIQVLDDKFDVDKDRITYGVNGIKKPKIGYCSPKEKSWYQDKFKERGSNNNIADIQKTYGSDLRPNDGATRLGQYSVLTKSFVNITPTETDLKNGVKKYMFSIENLAWKDTANVLSEEQKGPNGGRIMWFPPYNLKFSENVNVNWNENNFIGRGESIYTYTNTNRSGTLDFTLLIDHPSIINKFELDDNLNDNNHLLNFFLNRTGIAPEKIKNIQDKVTDSIIVTGASEQQQEKQQEKQDDGIKSQDINKNPIPEPAPDEKVYFLIFFPHLYRGIPAGGKFKDNSGKRDLPGCVDILKRYNNGENIALKEYIKETSLTSTFKNEEYNYAPVDGGDITTVLDRMNKGINFDTMGKKVIDNNIQGEKNLKFFNFETLSNLDGQKLAETFFDKTGYTCTIKDFETTSVMHGDEISDFNDSGRHEKQKISNYANLRAYFVEQYLRYVLKNFNLNRKGDRKILKIDEKAAASKYNMNSDEVRESRYVLLTLNLKWEKSDTAISDPTDENVTLRVINQPGENPGTGQAETGNTVSQTIVLSNKYTYDNEYLYFKDISSDNFKVETITQKVKYFNPTFHSITPEGFNSRLTFLHQCTRQGPTTPVSGGDVKKLSTDYLKFAGNLAFGRAPYCVLRIGDFFNTKICIDSISISYDNSGVQWDLNPAGVGVQPMFANVSISFKFLGGQDISGPIERLQNAVTANYYANASVYSEHADTKTEYFDAVKNKRISKK